MRRSFYHAVTRSVKVPSIASRCARSFPRQRAFSGLRGKTPSTMADEQPPRTKRPIQLIVDWDGTLTRKDTMSILADIGYTEQARQGITVPPWIEFGSAYMKDYSSHEEGYQPRKHERTMIPQERMFLASLRPVEVASAQRVQDSRLFRGVTRKGIREAAFDALSSGKLQLRRGWCESFSVILEKDTASTARNSLEILSVNWSQQFIKECLEAAAKEQGDMVVAQKIAIGSVPINANEIQGEDEKLPTEPCTGALVRASGRDIRTSADKLSRLPRRCRQNLDVEERMRSSLDEPMVVYVGDSTTDLECLLAADVGICMRDEPMGSSQKELAQTLDRLSIAVRGPRDHMGPADGHALYWVQDFVQVGALLGQLKCS